jgi:hypothetical protein
LFCLPEETAESISPPSLAAPVLILSLQVVPRRLPFLNPMKRAVPVLILSFGLNVYLFIAVLRSGYFGAGFSSFTHIQGDRQDALFGARGMTTRNNPTDWKVIEADSLGGLPSRLRDAGFPEYVVRAIIRAEVGSLYAARRRAIAEKVTPTPYWSRDYGHLSADAVCDYESLTREQDKTTATLLGVDPTESDESDDPLRQRQMSGLSSTQFSSVEAINADYNELQGRIVTKADGTLLPEDAEKLAYLEKQRQSDLAELLSPAELFEYQLRSSLLSSQLRTGLKRLKPTEEEFRAIFKAQQALEENDGPSDSPDSNQNGARASRQAEVQSQIQQILGPDRFLEFQKSSDPAFQAAYQIVDRLNLPSEAVDQVEGIRSEIGLRAEEIQRDPNLNEITKNNQLTELADEATSKLTSILGNDGMAAYQQSGGFWLQGLRAPQK